MPVVHLCILLTCPSFLTHFLTHFDRSKRHQPSQSVDVIYMWVFNDLARYKDAKTYDIAEDYQRLEAAEGPRTVTSGLPQAAWT